MKITVKTAIIMMAAVVFFYGNAAAEMTFINDMDMSNITGQAGLDVGFMTASRTSGSAEALTSPVKETALLHDQGPLKDVVSVIDAMITADSDINVRMTAQPNPLGGPTATELDVTASKVTVDLNRLIGGENGRTSLNITNLNVKMTGNVSIKNH